MYQKCLQKLFIVKYVKLLIYLVNVNACLSTAGVSESSGNVETIIEVIQKTVLTEVEVKRVIEYFVARKLLPSDVTVGTDSAKVNTLWTCLLLSISHCVRRSSTS